MAERPTDPAHATGAPRATDAELVRDARQSDTAAFEALTARHFPMVYALVYARLGAREAAEDLAQEVFLLAYLHLGALAEPGHFASWIGRIARNESVSWLRRSQSASRLVRMVPLDDLLAEPVAPGADGARTALEADEETRALHEALFQLPEELREVVVLHYFEDLTKAEIAERLEVHPATVGRQIEKAVKAMKRTLEPMLRRAAPAFRHSGKAAARTTLLVGAVAAMSGPAKAALLAEVGASAAMLAAATQTVAVATSWHTIFSGGFLMSVKTQLAAVAVVLALLAGGAYFEQSRATPGAKDDGQQTTKVEQVQPTPAVVSDDERTFQQIGNASQANLQRLRSGKIDAEIRSVAYGTQGGPGKESTAKVSVTYSGEKVRMVYDTPELKGTSVSTEEGFYEYFADGTTAYVRAPQGSEDDQYAVVLPASNSALALGSLPDPEFRRKEALSAKLSKVVLDGTELYRLDFVEKRTPANLFTYFIDPAKGYTISRHESSHDFGAGRVLLRVDTAEVQPTANGAWYLKKFDEVGYNPDGKLRSEKHVVIRNSSFGDEIPGETFSWEGMGLPVGTTIIDRRKGDQVSRYEESPGESRGAKTVGLPDAAGDPLAPFYALYRLDDGKVLKHIPRPFIPERAEYFLQKRQRIDNPSFVAFQWDGELRSRSETWGGQMTVQLSEILFSCAGLALYEFEGPDDLLKVGVAGDWIVRKGASQEDLLKVLGETLKKDTGRDIRFVKREVEREAIVVRGKYEFHPVPGNTVDRDSVHIYVATVDPTAVAGGGSGTVGEFLRYIGSMMRHPAIDGTQSGDLRMNYRNDEDGSLDGSPGDPAKVRKILDNLTKQTSLTFTLEKRPVGVWFVSEGNADQN
jgi:RNA polymerase sigma-70 factor (ECF subfamily)